MVRFDIDEQQIRKIAELLHETNLAEIEIVEKDCRLRLVRAVTYSEPSVFSASVPSSSPASLSSGRHGISSAEQQELSSAELHPGTIVSPLVGTVYISPEPGAAPFVLPGHVVQTGQILLLIETMKVMNPIRATKAGTVIHILINDAQPIEYGDPLIVIE